MSVIVTCDGEDGDCGECSPFMAEDYATGAYCYRLPRGWKRTDDGHICPKCAVKDAEASGQTVVRP